MSEALVEEQAQAAETEDAERQDHRLLLPRVRLRRRRRDR